MAVASSSNLAVHLQFEENIEYLETQVKLLSKKVKYYKCSNTNGLPLAILHGNSNDGSSISFHHALDTLVFGYH